MIVFFYFDDGKLTFEPSGICPDDMEPQDWASSQFQLTYGFNPIDWAYDYEVID